MNCIYLTHGFTIGNRYYAPVPALGGAEEVMRVSREIHLRGGKWRRYFHGNSYDPFFATADSLWGVSRNSIPEAQCAPDWVWHVRKLLV